MQHIHIIAVGGLREAGFAASCTEYAKRLGAYCKLHMVEVSEEKIAKNPGEAQIQRCIQEEGHRILAKIPEKAYTFALCIEGRQLSSEELARSLEELGHTRSALAFVIGGSHGLSEEVRRRADRHLSMSAMTFPHQLARVMLLEQVYRGFSILAGSKYHK